MFLSWFSFGFVCQSTECFFIYLIGKLVVVLAHYFQIVICAKLPIVACYIDYFYCRYMTAHLMYEDFLNRVDEVERCKIVRQVKILLDSIDEDEMAR